MHGEDEECIQNVLQNRGQLCCTGVELKIILKSTK
jgi:hypothetical protein